MNRLTSAALMAAMIFVVTFATRIPLPVASGGYLNLGDTVIYIAASLLGGPAAAAAAAIGSALADLSGGDVAYAAPTAVVKGLMGFVCGRLMVRGGHRRFFVASVLGGAIMVGGYAAVEVVWFNFNQALVSIPFNMAQWAASVAIATVLYPAVERIRKFSTKKL